MKEIHRKLIRTIADSNNRPVPCFWLAQMQAGNLVFTRYETLEPMESISLEQWQKAVLINSDPAKCDTLVILADKLHLIENMDSKPLIVAVQNDNPLQALRNLILLSI